MEIGTGTAWAIMANRASARLKQASRFNYAQPGLSVAEPVERENEHNEHLDRESSRELERT